MFTSSTISYDLCGMNEVFIKFVYFSSGSTESSVSEDSNKHFCYRMSLYVLKLYD